MYKCLDSSECISEQGYGWWADDRQITDSTVGTSVFAQRNAGEAHVQQRNTEWFQSIHRGALRQSSWGKRGVLYSRATQEQTLFYRTLEVRWSTRQWSQLRPWLRAVSARHKWHKRHKDRQKYQERQWANVCMWRCLAWLHCHWLYSVISAPVWVGSENCKQLTHLLFPLSLRSASG